MKNSINKLTIKGFKSIKELADFELSNLNIIIGANGAGKSNFVEIFCMLMAMAQKSFSKFILERGGADSFLFNGPKITQAISVELEFNQESNSYRFKLTPTVNEKFIISEERKYNAWRSYGSPTEESRLYDERNEKSWNEQYNGVGYFVYAAISNWMVYHFHDTSATAPMRRSEIIEDYIRLRSNAANIAPVLLNLKTDATKTSHYNKIIDAIRLVLPFFDDFQLNVQTFGVAEKVKLTWTQKGSDFPMQPYHLSDGSIRFICLATALLQPNPPSTIIIDEPELGLHPAAIVILAELIQIASQRTQVIIATQSPALIDQFAITDIIVINRKNGASSLERLTEESFSEWLKDYSIGELWTKNVISGGPVHE